MLLPLSFSAVADISWQTVSPVAGPLDDLEQGSVLRRYTVSIWKFPLKGFQRSARGARAVGCLSTRLPVHNTQQGYVPYLSTLRTTKAFLQGTRYNDWNGHVAQARVD